MSHTPGPWENEIETGIILGKGGIEMVAGVNPKNRQANARLIESAPELLEFVQQIFNGLDTGMITLDSPADETLANVVKRGRKALAKAKGSNDCG